MNERTNQEWLEALHGARRNQALVDLRTLLLHGLRHALSSRAGVTESDLEDFVQDALLRILDNLDTFRGESRFTTWAHKIAVRVALTEIRRSRWRDVSLQDRVSRYEGVDITPQILVDPAPDPAQLAAWQMMMAMVQRVMMEELTDKQGLAILAVMQGGMPLQEVADRLGTNRNALYKLLHDARRRLQARLMADGISPADLLSMFEAG